MASNTDALVDEIEQIRLRLADTVDELVDAVNPRNVARRGLASFKAKFVDETGSVRFEVVGPLVLGSAAVVGTLVVVRRVVRG